jgi:hypothetical protein
MKPDTKIKYKIIGESMKIYKQLILVFIIIIFSFSNTLAFQGIEWTDNVETIVTKLSKNYIVHKKNPVYFKNIGIELYRYYRKLNAIDEEIFRQFGYLSVGKDKKMILDKELEKIRKSYQREFAIYNEMRKNNQTYKLGESLSISSIYFKSAQGTNTNIIGGMFYYSEQTKKILFYNLVPRITSESIHEIRNYYQKELGKPKIKNYGHHKDYEGKLCEIIYVWGKKDYDAYFICDFCPDNYEGFEILFINKNNIKEYSDLVIKPAIKKAQKKIQCYFIG